METVKYTLEDYREAAETVKERIGTADTAVVLGSGLGKWAERLEDISEIPYSEIPHFPVSTVASHAGKLISGTWHGKRILCMSGRVHYYEGYSFEEVAFPVRASKFLGVKKLILTNAAGGVNRSFSVGDFMLISDQINFMACAPLRGEELDYLGPRFFDMSRVYSGGLRQRAKEAAEKCGIALREGVYFYMPGPQFETPAEIRAIRILGGDAVGMSTVVEAMAARQAGMEILGISFISNLAAGMTEQGLSDNEVVKTANENAARFERFLGAVLDKMED